MKGSLRLSATRLAHISQGLEGSFLWTHRVDFSLGSLRQALQLCPNPAVSAKTRRKARTCRQHSDPGTPARGPALSGQEAAAQCDRLTAGRSGVGHCPGPAGPLERHKYFIQLSLPISICNYFHLQQKQPFPKCDVSNISLPPVCLGHSSPGPP